MKKRKTLYYYLLYIIAKIRYRKTKIEYKEEIKEPSIFVVNHARIDGPTMMYLYFKRLAYFWVIHCALDEKLALNYAYHDVLLGDIRRHKGFYNFLAKRIAKSLPKLMKNSANCIPVYHDYRIKDTLNETIEALMNGYNAVIFAESPIDYSKYIANLQTGFVSIGNLYYRKTGKIINFYPVYVSQKRKRILIGKPIEYNNENNLKEERNIINDYLVKNITDLALSLKKHKPITFLPSKWYLAYGKYANDVASYWKMIESGKREK
jgi:hypothetical protein